jgi:hypothetical protein
MKKKIKLINGTYATREIKYVISLCDNKGILRITHSYDIREIII